MAIAEAPDRIAGWDDGWLRDARRCDSPNFGPRPPGAEVSLVVIHSISLPPGEYAGDSAERLFTNRLDWDAHPYYERIRGLSPAPGAWCETTAGGKPERLRLLRSAPAAGSGRPGEILDGALTVACGNGAVRLVELQRAGGRPVGADEFLRGARMNKGDRLA